MSLSGFLLVLAAAFCHAAWNYAVKRIDGGPELVWLFSFVSVVIYLPVAVVIVWLEPPTFGLLGAAFIAGSAALHLGYFLLLQQGYRHGDLSLVYPTARATSSALITRTSATAAIKAIETKSVISWEFRSQRQTKGKGKVRMKLPTSAV